MPPSPKPTRSIWRTIRVSVLMYVLAMVALGTWLAKSRSTDWDDTLYMAIYPVNGDGSERSAAYIQRLEEVTFKPIEEFLGREINRYGHQLKNPVIIELGAPVNRLPPEPPQDRHPLKVVLWSLQLRYFAWSVERRQDLPTPDIRMFAVYHDPDSEPRLAHSLGLEKGLIGVVNAYTGRTFEPRNNVVIAHEMLHTLGASDKYDARTNLPVFPQGFAEPERAPLYPQQIAEIMGGRIPLSSQEAAMPDSLLDSLVGPYTAAEIQWVELRFSDGS